MPASGKRHRRRWPWVLGVIVLLLASVAAVVVQVWFSTRTGLPLRVQQDLKVTNSAPFGTSTYTQVGVFVLASLVAHR